MVRTITKEEALKTIRERGNLDSEIEDMSLSELRKLHQALFERAVTAGRKKLGNRFDIAVLKGRLDNTFEHMRKNMCPNSIDFCNRKNCDNYDPDCVARKMKEQMKRLISEILRPSSIGPWTRSRAMW